MTINTKSPIKGKNILIIVEILIISVTIGGLVIQEIKAQTSSLSSDLSQTKELSVIQGNSLIAVSNPSYDFSGQSIQRKLEMVITAYSSTPWETDDTPFITASGARVKQGVVANNLLPFGTKVKIPELYGDRIFEVKDRMHWRKGYYHLDIWFPEHSQAKNFGAKTTYIEVL